MKFDIWLFFEKSVERIQISLKSDKNNGYFTWRTINIFNISQFFLELEMFQINAVEKLETRTACSFNWPPPPPHPRKSCRLWDNVEKCGAGHRWHYGARALHSGYLRLQIHTHTHTKYSILIAFPLQHWLHERDRMLRCTYITRLVSSGRKNMHTKLQVRVTVHHSRRRRKNLRRWKVWDTDGIISTGEDRSTRKILPSNTLLTTNPTLTDV